MVVTCIIVSTTTPPPPLSPLIIAAFVTLVLLPPKHFVDGARCLCFAGPEGIPSGRGASGVSLPGYPLVLPDLCNVHGSALDARSGGGRVDGGLVRGGDGKGARRRRGSRWRHEQGGPYGALRGKRLFFDEALLFSEGLVMLVGSVLCVFNLAASSGSGGRGCVFLEYYY